MRISTVVAAVLALGAAAAAQQVTVTQAWVRGTLAGQTDTGAFMKLQAPQGVRLVGAVTPVAGVTEIHETKQEGHVTRMRAVPALELPPGRTVELAPGGYHVMLMDLRQPLRTGLKVPLSLRFESGDGEPFEVRVDLVVNARAGARAAPPRTGGSQGGHHGHPVH